MASTAWTARREDLVRELAAARTEREIAANRLQAALAKEAERKARQREEWHRRKLRNEGLARAAAVATAAVIPPDPLAHKHRQDLIAALKEKP